MPEYTEQELVESIACCGLICRLCPAYERCGGCVHLFNECTDTLSAGICPLFDCTGERKMEGCWKCECFPCTKGSFSSSYADHFIAYVRCIQEEGKAGLIRCVVGKYRNKNGNYEIPSSFPDEEKPLPNINSSGESCSND